MSRNTINSRVFGTTVSEEVRNTFENLQKGSFQSDILAEVENQYQDYLGDRTTFARMWSPTLISGSIVDENDEKQQVQEVLYRVVNDNRPESYTTNELDSVGVVTELTENDSLKPAAGITDVNISTGGSLGAVKYTDINFVVFSRRDFEEIYLPYFMRPGATVILDYGWSDTSIDLYDIKGIVENSDVNLENLKSSLYGGKLQGPEGQVVKKNSKGTLFYKVEGGVVTDTKKMKGGPGFVNKPNHEGKVDSILGVVQDYSANWDGVKFNCKIKLVSQNFSLLDKEVTDENDLKFIFNNRFEKILINFLSGPENSDDIDTAYENFEDRTAETKTKIISKYFRDIGVRTAKKGVVNLKSIKSGIYYQDYTADLGTKNKNFTQPYISFGLFEDLFLNAIVLENVSNKENYQVEFNSKDCLVRFEENLYKRQTTDVTSDSVNLPLFLYPCDKSEFEDKLVHSYNMKSLHGDNSTNKENEVKSLLVGGDYTEHNDPVIYFRDLFISTRLISQAFKSKNTLNDVLVDIVTKINTDSYGVFDIKMISANRSDGVIGLVDNNLMNPPPEPEETLTFDVYSERSIVSDMNYEFVMPKGGLSSVLAIGESPTSSLFHDKNRDDANFIQQLNLDFKEGYRVLSLPIVKEKPEESEEEETYPYSLESEAVKSIKNTVGNLGKANFSSIVSKTKDKSSNNKDKKTTLDNKYTSTVDKNQIGADDDQDRYGKQARQNTVYAEGINKPAPILPIELSLTIYGNTLLNIGDIISVSYLPDYLKEKVFFIITNIENKIGTTWSTTYKCQMRLRPTLKGRSISELKEIVYSSSFVKKMLQGDDRNNPFLKAVLEGQKTKKYEDNLPEPTKVYITEAYFNPKKTEKFEGDGQEQAGFAGQWCYSKVFSEGINSWEDLYWAASLQTAVGELLEKFKQGGGVLKNAFNVSHEEKRIVDQITYKNVSGLKLINSIPGNENNAHSTFFNVIVDKGGDFGMDALFNSKGYLKKLIKNYNTDIAAQSVDGSELISVESVRDSLIRRKILRSAVEKWQSIIKSADTQFKGDLTKVSDWNGEKLFFKGVSEPKHLLITDYAFLWNNKPTLKEGRTKETSTIYVIRFGGKRRDFIIPKYYFDVSGYGLDKFIKKIYDTENELNSIGYQFFAAKTPNMRVT